MAVTVNFKTASKKVNSTAVVGGTVTAINCNINEPCTIENPQIILRNGGSVPSWNYCTIPDFGGRSYWIEDWQYINNTWVAICSVDVLATYRDTIASTNLYFLRSSTSYDGDIMDTLYPTLSTPDMTHTVVTDGAFPASEYGLSQGSFICGIVGEDGLTNFYGFTPTKFASFCNKIFSTIDWANISGQQITESLLKCLFNPFQYLTSVMWFPFNADAGSKKVTAVKFGFWEVTVDAYKLSNLPFYRKSFTMPVKQHPQVSRGTFLNSSPYRHIRIIINPWGSFEIDGGKVGTSSTVTVNKIVDCMSGIGYITVNSGDISLYSAYAQVGVNIQVSDLRTNVLQSGGDILGSIASIFTGNFIGSAVGIANAVESAIPDVNTKGANSSLISIASAPVINEIFYKLVDEDRGDNGRPYMKNATMSELGVGYYVVENGNIFVSGATRTEKEQIRQYLEGGVYYA